MRRFIMFAAAFTLSGSLLAQATAPASTVPAAAPEKEKKICRREQVTGSIMQQRICHTREEWAAIDEANRQAAQNFAASKRMGRGSSPN